VAIAVEPIFAPRPRRHNPPLSVYIEPGSEMLRAPDGSKQVYGKVVVDMRTGKIWGFPTNAPQSYPIAGLQNKPPRLASVRAGKVRV
jgi:hypothetical protein